jgi:hypothetical protein
MDGTRTERHECGCVTQTRTWQVPGWACFATATLVNCGGHQPAPKRTAPEEDWEAVLLASVR